MRVSVRYGRTRLSHVVSASSGRHDERGHLFVGVDHDGVIGWGEISPQPTRIHGDPGEDEVLATLLEDVVARFLRLCETLGEVPTPGRLGAGSSGRPSDRFATSGLELALLDWHLRRSDLSLHDRFPARFAPAQIRSAPDEWARATETPERWRVKVGGPARTTAWWASLAERGGDVLLDFNAGAQSPEEVLDALAEAQQWSRVVAIEQPFAVGNLAAVAQLASRLDVALSLDEGVRTTKDVNLAARHGVTLLCVKAGRVGGWSKVEMMAARAKERGVEVYLGGFFDTSLGRAVTRVAASNLTHVPSDVGEVSFSSASLVEEFPGGVGWRPRTNLTVIFDRTDGES